MSPFFSTSLSPCLSLSYWTPGLICRPTHTRSTHTHTHVYTVNTHTIPSHKQTQCTHTHIHTGRAAYTLCQLRSEHPEINFHWVRAVFRLVFTLHPTPSFTEIEWDTMYIHPQILKTYTKLKHTHTLHTHISISGNSADTMVGEWFVKCCMGASQMFGSVKIFVVKLVIFIFTVKPF